MKKVMAIFAHPDDEGAVGGTLHHLAQQGHEVTLVCGTRGEVGEISDPALATPETLGEVRQGELEAACKILGIQNLEFLDYRDSGMVGTPENEDPRALINADSEEMIGKLHRLWTTYQPDTIITFEPFGWYGHPDHQAVSKWVGDAFDRLKENAEAVPALYHAVMPFSKFGPMMEAAIEKGYIEPNDEPGFADQLPMEKLMATEAMVTHDMSVADSFDTKQEAMTEHRTQFAEDGMFSKIPREMMIEVTGTEYFIQVYPQPAAEASQNRLHDLFQLA